MNDVKCGICGQVGVTLVNAYESGPGYWCQECGSVGEYEDGTWERPAALARLDAAERVVEAARVLFDTVTDTGAAMAEAKLHDAVAAYDAGKGDGK